MVQVIEGKDRHSFPELFDRIFRARYETFVLAREWSLPARNGREIDQYDNDNAVYFVDFDETGHLQGSVRLTPTLTNSLTADYYSHLCQPAIALRDPFIYEGTRYIATPRERTLGNNRIAKARILGAMTEWAWSLGITHIQTVIDAALFKTFKEVNSEVFSLGPAQDYGGGKKVKGGGSCLVIRLPATKRAIGEICAYGGLDAASLRASYIESDLRVKKIA
jgi:N-acyl-L-homoserine lactone synthetase